MAEKKKLHLPTIDGAVLKQIMQNMQIGKRETEFLFFIFQLLTVELRIVMLTLVDKSLLLKFYYLC